MSLQAGQPGHRRFTNSISIAIATVGMVIASGFAAFILYYFHLVDFLTLFVNGIIRVMAVVFYFAVIFVYVRYVLSLNYEYAIFYGLDEPAPPKHAAGEQDEEDEPEPVKKPRRPRKEKPPAAEPERAEKPRRARKEKSPEAEVAIEPEKVEEPQVQISLAQPFAPPPEEPKKKRGLFSRREKTPEEEPEVQAEPGPEVQTEPEPEMQAEPEIQAVPELPAEPSPQTDEKQKPSDNPFDIHIENYDI